MIRAPCPGGWAIEGNTTAVPVPFTGAPLSQFPAVLQFPVVAGDVHVVICADTPESNVKEDKSRYLIFKTDSLISLPSIMGQRASIN
jgi:hypothetical protein